MRCALTLCLLMLALAAPASASAELSASIGAREVDLSFAPLHEGGGELIGVIGIAAPSETPGAGGARRR